MRCATGSTGFNIKTRSSSEPYLNTVVSYVFLGQIKYFKKNFTMCKTFLLKYARNIRVLLPNLVFLAACMLQ